VTVIWAPQRLIASIYAAFPPSVVVAAAEANMKAPSHKAGAIAEIHGPGHGGIRPTGLGVVFEHGRKGGYDIEPKTKKDLGGKRLGHPLGNVTGGPMRPRPYIHPAAVRWAQGGYQAQARRTLAATGFR
jgi:hypothetical protein